MTSPSDKLQVFNYKLYMKNLIKIVKIFFLSGEMKLL